jgi:hypothetical protein
VEKIQRNEIMSLPDYEKVRAELRAHIMALKDLRRIFVGSFVSFVFENRETVRWQIQEMVRAEAVTREEKVQEEIDIYNEMLPEAGELSATMFIEIADMGELRAWLPHLVNIEHSVALYIDGEAVKGVAEEGRSEEDRTSTVHYVRFNVPPHLQAKLANGQADLAVEHPHYTFRTSIPTESCAALAEDFKG